MDPKLRRDVRWLKIYALCSTAAFAVLALTAFQRPNAASKKTKFDEIDVERINVVEKDGKLRLDTNDEIIRETLLTQGGEVVNKRVREFFSLPALAART